MSTEEKGEIQTLIKDVVKVNKKWNLYKIGSFFFGLLWLTFLSGTWYRDGVNEYKDWAKWRIETNKNVKEVKDWEVDNQTTVNFAKDLKNKSVKTE